MAFACSSQGPAVSLEGIEQLQGMLAGPFIHLAPTTAYLGGGGGRYKLKKTEISLSLPGVGQSR